jgi:hypothetical protein
MEDSQTHSGLSISRGVPVHPNYLDLHPRNAVGRVHNPAGKTRGGSGIGPDGDSDSGQHDQIPSRRSHSSAPQTRGGKYCDFFRVRLVELERGLKRC